MQRLWINIEGQIEELFLPPGAEEVMPGVIWGPPDDGPVATCVGIDWRIFGRHEAIRSCGEVNDLMVWFLGEGLPSVDLAHDDVS